MHPTGGVGLEVLDDADVFGGDSDALQKKPESIPVQGVKGSLDIQGRCVQQLVVFPPLLHQDS